MHPPVQRASLVVAKNLVKSRIAKFENQRPTSNTFLAPSPAASGERSVPASSEGQEQRDDLADIEPQPNTSEQQSNATLAAPIFNQSRWLGTPFAGDLSSLPASPKDLVSSPLSETLADDNEEAFLENLSRKHRPAVPPESPLRQTLQSTEEEEGASDSERSRLLNLARRRKKSSARLTKKASEARLSNFEVRPGQSSRQTSRRVRKRNPTLKRVKNTHWHTPLSLPPTTKLSTVAPQHRRFKLRPRRPHGPRVFTANSPPKENSPSRKDGRFVRHQARSVFDFAVERDLVPEPLNFLRSFESNTQPPPSVGFSQPSGAVYDFLTQTAGEDESSSDEESGYNPVLDSSSDEELETEPRLEPSLLSRQGYSTRSNSPDLPVSSDCTFQLSTAAVHKVPGADLHESSRQGFNQSSPGQEAPLSLSLAETVVDATSSQDDHRAASTPAEKKAVLVDKLENKYRASIRFAPSPKEREAAIVLDLEHRYQASFERALKSPATETSNKFVDPAELPGRTQTITESPENLETEDAELTFRITRTLIKSRLDPSDSESNASSSDMDHLRPESALAISQHRKEAIRLAKVQESSTLEKCRRIGAPVPEYAFEELIGKGSFGRVYKW